MARRSAARHQLPPVPEAKFDYCPFAGGLDLETPGWQIPPGFVRDSLNYEIPAGGGYRDVAGYERLDGRTAPSAAQYAILKLTITGTIAVEAAPRIHRGRGLERHRDPAGDDPCRVGD